MCLLFPYYRVISTNMKIQPEFGDISKGEKGILLLTFTNSAALFVGVSHF
jgi:hypothetical protein